MSKVKKVLCFVLALAMVFALAVPAFAEGTGDGGVSTCGVGVMCPKCGNGARSIEHDLIGTRNVWHSGYGHNDVQTYYYDRVNCDSCGSTQINIRVISTYCPNA